MWNVNVVTNRFDDRSHDRRASVTVSHNGFLAIVARLSTWTAGSIPGTSGVEVRFSARVIFATCIYPAQRWVNFPLNRQKRSHFLVAFQLRPLITRFTKAVSQLGNTMVAPPRCKSSAIVLLEPITTMAAGRPPRSYRRQDDIECALQCHCPL